MVIDRDTPFNQYSPIVYSFVCCKSILFNNCLLLEFFGVVPRTLSILHAWRRFIGLSTRTMDHVSFYQIKQVFIKLRAWYLCRNYSINIIRRWIFVGWMQEQK